MPAPTRSRGGVRSKIQIPTTGRTPPRILSRDAPVPGRGRGQQAATKPSQIPSHRALWSAVTFGRWWDAEKGGGDRQAQQGQLVRRPAPIPILRSPIPLSRLLLPPRQPHSGTSSPEPVPCGTAPTQCRQPPPTLCPGHIPHPLSRFLASPVETAKPWIFSQVVGQLRND